VTAGSPTRHWQDYPLLKRIVQGYLAGGQAAEALVADAELDWQDSERMKFLMMNLIAAAAPSNNPLISPAGWKAALDTGGLSAVRGIRAITDLAPGRSMIEFLTGQGYQVFVMSWRNPDRRHKDWDLDAYGHAVVDALAAIHSIAKVRKASIMGLCAGGIITSMVGAHLSRTGQLGQIASLCLGVTVLDQAHAGMAAALLDEPAAAAAVLASSRCGYLDGRTLAEVLAWLRPTTWSGTTGSTTTCRAGRRPRSTSCTGTPPPPRCPPGSTATSSRSPWPTH